MKTHATSFKKKILYRKLKVVMIRVKGTPIKYYF